MKALVWVAVSSESQAAEDKVSLSQQEHECRAYAVSQGMTVMEVLSVPGFSRSESDIITMLDELAAQGCFAYHILRKHWQARDFDVLIAYADDRLGRSSTAVSYVIENTIKAGARIYLLHGGLVDKNSHRFRIAMSGVNVSQQIDQLVERRRMGARKRLERGLPTSAYLPYTHTVHRDEFGRAVSAMVVRDDRRRFLLDFAECILQGVGWKQMGTVLYRQYGHVNEKTGKPFAQATLFAMAYNPVVWGNNARLYQGAGAGLWAFDASVPVPAGVEIRYGTHEAAWSGELAFRVQNELRRRTVLTGRSSPFRSHRFSGLLYCDECHKALCFTYGSKVHGVNLRYYRCESRWRDPVYRQPCTQKKHISEAAVQAAVTAMFEAVKDKPDVLSALFGTPDSAAAVDYGAEIRALEAHIGQLIHLQSSAPMSVQKIYTAQIEDAAARLDVLTMRLQASERAKARDNQRGQVARQLQDVLKNLEAFWANDDRTVNQALHAIFGEYRLIVRDGRIVALARP